MIQSTTVVEGLSFGQSAGLKDDLDVDDNDVGEKKRLAFLDLLIESGQNGVVLSDTEIKEQVDTIMFEVCVNEYKNSGENMLKVCRNLFIAGSRHYCCRFQLLPFNDGCPP